MPFTPHGYLACGCVILSLLLSRLPGAPLPAPTDTADARPAIASSKEDDSKERPAKPAAALADGDKEKKSAAAAPANSNKLESLKIPPDAILVISDSLTEAMRLVPNAIVLRPEKYKELLEQIEKLKAQLSTEKPLAPSACKLTGKVEGDVAHLQAQFLFVTEKPNTAVFLACGQAFIENPKLDDRPAQIQHETDGYTAQVDKPGDHRLTFDLTLKLLPHNNGRGLELDLPRAASTALELSLPTEVKEKDLRVYDQPLAGTLLTFKNQQLTGLLGSADKRGPADKLDLSWKSLSVAAGATPIRFAEGRVQVRMDLQQMITEAELTLKARGVPVDEWRILVPTGADIKAAPADENRVRTIRSQDVISPKKVKIGVLKTVVLKEPELDPLVVQVTVYGSMPPPGTFVPIGPFLVLDAFQQTGTIVISSSAAELRPRFRQHGFLASRELTEEERRRNGIAAFNYWSLPAPKDLQKVVEAKALSMLEVEGQRVQGQIEARVTHTLTLATDNPEGEPIWRVVTVLDVKPIRNEVDSLSVRIPAEWVYDDKRSPGPSERVRDVEYDPISGVVRFHLSRASADTPKPFQLTLEALHRGRAAETGSLSLPLPRPNALEPGGPNHLVLIHASKGIELLVPEGKNHALELISREPHDQTWRTRRMPEQIDVSWRPYRPEVSAEGIADLTLSPREGHVRHVLKLRFHQEPLTQINLHVPEALADHLHVVEGGVAVDGPLRPGIHPVKLREPVGKEHRLVLEYSFALRDQEGTQPGQPIPIPLITLDSSVHGEVKVRVAGDPGVLPILASDAWVPAHIEEVKGWNRLPALVVRAARVDQPLALRLGEPTEGTLPALVDRVLVRVAVLEDGSQYYRVSFLISQLATPYLDLELPAPVLNLGPKATLDGLLVQGTARDESGQRTAGGRILRLELPEISRRYAVLELRYQVPSVRTGSGLLQSILLPPRLLSDAGKTLTRWQIDLPSGWVVLGPEAGPGIERTWGPRGWLLAPRLTTTAADLERWFLGTEPVAHEEANDSGIPTLVCWRNGLEPLTITYAPQQAWLMVCSLGLLLVGFALYLLARPRAAGRGLSTAWLMPAVTALVLAGAVVGLLWPTTLAAVVFGCEPGAAVLVVFAGIQWLLHERYRRQIIFLPSFSHGRNGSSLIRPTGSSQRRPEPTTVDAPPYKGSSQWPSAESG